VKQKKTEDARLIYGITRKQKKILIPRSLSNSPLLPVSDLEGRSAPAVSMSGSNNGNVELQPLTSST